MEQADAFLSLICYDEFIGAGTHLLSFLSACLSLKQCYSGRLSLSVSLTWAALFRKVVSQCLWHGSVLLEVWLSVCPSHEQRCSGRSSLSVSLILATLFWKVWGPGQSNHLSWKYVIHSAMMQDLGGNQWLDSKIYTLIHCMKTCKNHSKH